MMAERTDFDRIYAGVEPGQRETLRTFRAGHRAKYLEVDGRRWPYLSCGRGKKTLLLLAGAFLPADMWFYIIGELEKDFRILAPDTNMLVGLSARQALDALPRLMDSEGVRKVSLIGFSAGGGMAQMLLQEHPEMIENVVLSHTGIIEYRPEAEAYTRRVIVLVRFLPLSLIRGVMVRKMSGAVPTTGAWRKFHDAYYRENASRITRQVALCFFRNSIALRRESVFRPEALAAWRGHMLILGSKDDSVTMPALEKLKARYPTAAVRLFEEGGHHTFMLYPEAYASALRSFLCA